ncbi:MAG: hypothetical protein WKF29_07045 [Thermoleophilaceae bacterium]
MVSDTLANTARAAHDWGLASFLGGSMYGKFALNPAVRVIESKSDRGKVTNTAWNGYNVINAVSLAAVAGGWGAARLTEARPDRLSGRERDLAKAKDGFVISTLLTGIASGIQGARLAKQAPDGAVPVESGVTPAEETPKAAATIQRSLGMLGNLSILSGVGLVVTNAILAQTNYSRPPVRRGLLRRSS